LELRQILTYTAIIAVLGPTRSAVRQSTALTYSAARSDEWRQRVIGAPDPKPTLTMTTDERCRSTGDDQRRAVRGGGPVPRADGELSLVLGRHNRARRPGQIMPGTWPYRIDDRKRSEDRMPNETIALAQSWTAPRC